MQKQISRMENFKFQRDQRIREVISKIGVHNHFLYSIR